MIIKIGKITVLILSCPHLIFTMQDSQSSKKNNIDRMPARLQRLAATVLWRDAKRSDYYLLRDDLKDYVKFVGRDCYQLLQEKRYDEVLWLAVDRGHDHVVHELLETGMLTTDAPSRFEVLACGYKIPLIEATKRGLGDLITFFLNEGAAVDRQDRDSCTALMNAAREGHCDCLKILLEYHAEINKHNEFGITALMMAASHGNAEAVKILLQQGADVNVQSAYGTALTFASKKKHVDCVEFLLQYKPRLDCVDNENRTAQRWAEYNNDVTCLALFEKYKKS